MIFYYRFLLAAILTICFAAANAQTDAGNQGLIKEGINLTKDKRYSDALEKFKTALVTDPADIQANYQAGFSLFSMGKNAEAIPYLLTAIKGSTTPGFTAAAYSLLGSVYGNAGQLQNAILSYQNGIKADSSNQRIYYNLGIIYFKNRQYDNAQLSFIQAIKKDVNDAGSTRMYALAAFHQNKRAEALLGFCRFLILEPNSPRSAEAFDNLQNILQGGKLAAEPGQTKIIPGYIAAQNLLITKAMAHFTNRNNANGDILAGELKAIFTALNTPHDKDYFLYKLAGYFANLAQTDYMPAFARYISQSAVQENAKWLKDNIEKSTAAEDWMAKTNLF